MPSSTTTFASKRSASSTPAPISSRSWILTTPTLLPPFAAFANSGMGSDARSRSSDSRRDAHCAAVTTRVRGSGSPAPAKSAFISALSIPIADAATPAPT